MDQTQREEKLSAALSAITAAQGHVLDFMQYGAPHTDRTKLRIEEATTALRSAEQAVKHINPADVPPQKIAFPAPPAAPGPGPAPGGNNA